MCLDESYFCCSQGNVINDSNSRKIRTNATNKQTCISHQYFILLKMPSKKYLSFLAELRHFIKGYIQAHNNSFTKKYMQLTSGHISCLLSYLYFNILAYVWLFTLLICALPKSFNIFLLRSFSRQCRYIRSSRGCWSSRFWACLANIRELILK